MPKGMKRLVPRSPASTPRSSVEGNVTLEIFCRSNVSVWQRRNHCVEPMHRQEINVEIDKSAEQLRLEVGYGANLDFGDRLALGGGTTSSQ